jgi:hypothetical protein
VLLLGPQVAQVAAAPLPANVDRGALMCPYMIMVNLADFQRRCHPEDREFNAKLNGPIRQMEQFFLANKWIDEKTIDLTHYGFDKMSEEMKLHPLHMITGTISDICKYADLERLYEHTRKSADNIRREFENLIANPPLMKTPYGTPCL